MSHQIQHKENCRFINDESIYRGTYSQLSQQVQDQYNAVQDAAADNKQEILDAISNITIPNDYATESNATANKQEILSAIAAIDPYVELTDEEIDSIAEPDTSTEETTEENEQSNEETTNE